MAHAVSERQKRGQASDPHTRSRDFTLSNLSEISIKDLLKVVNTTHQSILSEDVLRHFNEQRDPEGFYTDQVKFSLKSTDSKGWRLSAAQRELDVDRIKDAAESSGFGESGKRALTAAYDGEPEAAAYFAGFSVLYHAGLTGVEESKVKSPYISPLTPAQRYAAYTAGQNDAAVSLNREKDGAAYGPVRSEEAGLVACFLGGRQKSQPGGHEVPGYFTFHDWHHQHRGFP